MANIFPGVARRAALCFAIGLWGAAVSTSPIYAQDPAVGQYPSIAIGSDSNPVISYYDNTNGDLKRYRCRTTDCS